jgi:UDP-2,3-diacylglucosamine pyrophosphatase LpxH
MNICVISDVHYKYRQESPADRENSQLFLSFLEGIAGRYDLLVLNGDIFDLYQRLEIHDRASVFFRCCTGWPIFLEAGCRIVYISGNHDFWFNGFLDKELGFELYATTIP